MALVRFFNAGSAAERLVEAGLLKAEHVERFSVVITRLVALEVFELRLIHDCIQIENIK